MHEQCSRINSKENWMNLDVVLITGLTAEVADPIKTQRKPS